MKTKWKWDGYHQQWTRELFIEGVVRVYEVKDKFLPQHWFELHLGREAIHIPPTALGPLQDAVQAMIERKL